MFSLRCLVTLPGPGFLCGLMCLFIIDKEVAGAVRMLGSKGPEPNQSQEEHSQFQTSRILGSLKRNSQCLAGTGSGPNRTCTCCEPDILSWISIPVRQCKASSQNPLTLFLNPGLWPGIYPQLRLGPMILKLRREFLAGDFLSVEEAAEQGTECGICPL